MGRRPRFVLSLLAILCVGCAKKPTSAPVQMTRVVRGIGGGGGGEASLSTFSVYAGAPQRYVAESHKLEIISPESQLASAWQAVVSFCGTIQCEIVNSSITNRTRDAVPSGTITLRVAPDALSKLFAFVEKQGITAQHTTERQDKTTQVVDTEAKIKNLTSFRDSLRAMQAKLSSVKDSIDIQQQLTDVQSQLDSETAARKILANETEKVAVEIVFRVDRPAGAARGFAQIAEALRDSGDVLADSTASLITFIVSVIPWLILIVPGCWLLARVWRRFRAKRTSAKAAASP
jgi:hypothetical protein